ncbi:MAG: TolC family protein [Gemmatimonadaceae bacterium]
MKRLLISLFSCLAAGFPLPAQQTSTSSDSATSLLKDRIRRSSPEVEARRAAYEVARARLNATGLSQAASLEADLEEMPGLQVSDAGSMRVSVSRDFVPRSVKVAARRGAERDVELAQLELEIAIRLLDAAADQLLVRSSGGLLIAARLAAEDSLLVSVDAALRSRFAVGDARYVDVLRLRTERLRVQVELQHIQAAYRLSRGQLLRLASPGAIGGRSGPFDFAALRSGDGSADTVVSEAIAAITGSLRQGTLPPAPSMDSLFLQSIGVRVADLAVDRAAASRNLAIATQRPVLAASLGVQRFAREAGGFSMGPALGASVTLPFTARKSNRAQSALADRELLLAKAERSAATAELASDLATAHERYEAARTIYGSFDEALLRGSREEREAALASYRNGSLTLLELLDFERALAQAEVTRIRSRIEAADAFVTLLATAAGGEVSHGNRPRSMNQDRTQDAR